MATEYDTPPEDIVVLLVAQLCAVLHLRYRLCRLIFLVFGTALEQDLHTTVLSNCLCVTNVSTYTLAHHHQLYSGTCLYAC